MTFLPVVERELRARARQGRTYWTRFAVGLCGAFICVLQLTFRSMSGGAATAGGYAFQGLVVAAFLICCSGCLATADAISWERREGTLGLLFLTNVRGLDVVLGKLSSAATANVCALMAFLPVLMIPVLSGGVTGGEAFRKGLVLLNTLFLALAVGLWASTRATELFKTIRKALLTLLLILFVPAVIDGWLLHGGPVSHNTIGLLSPLVGMRMAGDAMYQVFPGALWTSLLLIHTMAWAFVAWTAVHLRKSLQSDGTLVVHSRKVHRYHRARFRGRTAPVAWLVSRQRGIRTMIWSAVAVGFLLFGMRYFTPFLYTSRTTTLVYATMWPLSLAQSVVVGSLFAWAASRFFFEARRTGELELLVTTPVGAKTIVSAQWKALWRMVRWPLVVMILPHCFQVLTMVMHLASSWRIVYMFSTLLGVINTVLGVLVLFWLGMWFGLKSPTQTVAIIRAVVWGKAGPFCLSLASLLIINLAGSILGFSYLRNLIIPLLPQVVVIAYYLWLLKRMKGHLQGELRDVDPVWGGAATEASALWKRGMGMLRDARHWTPMNSK